MTELNLKPLLYLNDWFNLGKGEVKGLKGLNDDPDVLRGFCAQCDLLNEMASQYGSKRKSRDSTAKIKKYIQALIDMNIPIHPEIARRYFNNKIGKPKITERTIKDRCFTDAAIRTIYKSAKNLFKVQRIDLVDEHIGQCLNFDVLNKAPAYRRMPQYKETCSKIAFYMEWVLKGWVDAPVGKLSLPKKECLNDFLLMAQLMYGAKNPVPARSYFVNNLCRID